jgi:hypothetical protein
VKHAFNAFITDEAVEAKAAGIFEMKQPHAARRLPNQGVFLHHNPTTSRLMSRRYTEKAY